MDRRRMLVVAAAIVAALGAVLVFVYVQGADNRAQDQFKTTAVLVAKTQINAGESIEQATQAGKIDKKAIVDNALVPGYLVDTSTLTGEVAQVNIYPGEQILASKFSKSAAPVSALQIPSGKMAISVNLTDPARVAGFVQPGSQVSIFMQGSDPKKGQPFSQLLLPDVTVIGVGSTTPVATTTTDTSGNQTTEQLPRTLLTLAVDQTEAQKVPFASTNGALAFALLPDGTTAKPQPPTTFDNLFG